MTDSANPAPAGRTVDQVVSDDSRTTCSPTAQPVGRDPIGIDAELEGGPTSLPTELRKYRVPPTQRKIKVRHLGGHEHFERDPSGVVGHATVVFHWTGRTRIAE